MGILCTIGLLVAHVFQFNHPDMVQEVLVRDAAMQHRGIVMQRAKFVLGEGLSTSEEPTHMCQREACPAGISPTENCSLR